MNHTKIKALHVPLGTRCECVTRHVVDHDGFGLTISWRVWLAIKNKQVEPSKYEGTYLELLSDGSVRQSTTDREDYEVMEGFV